MEKVDDSVKVQKSTSPKEGPPPNKSFNKFSSRSTSTQSSPLSYTNINIGDNIVHAFIDTGASISLISESLYNDLSDLKRRHLNTVASPSVYSVAGEPLDVLGSLNVSFSMSSMQLQHCFIVVRNIKHALILGWDFLIANNVVLDLSNSNLQMNGNSIPMLHREELIPISCSAVIAETTQVPANSEKNVLLKIFSNDHTLISCDYPGILEPDNNTDVLFARTLTISKDGYIPVLVMNSTPDDISLYENTTVGQFHSVIGQKGEIYEIPVNTENVNVIDKKSDSQTSHFDFNFSDSDLSSCQKEEVQELLSEYSDIFSKHPNDYGRTNLLYHVVDTGDSSPVRQRAYRVSPKLHTELQKQIDTLLEQDLIEPSTSEYSAPALLVKKKTPGQWRLVIDYRKTNLVSLTDSHPLPRIDDSIDALRGSSYFSSIDLAGAFWQVEMDPQSKHKTAFSTGDGLYQWKVMPMGLKNSSRTFQRLMELVFNGMHWTRVCVYIDDVVIFGKTFSDKMKNLREVFERLRNAGLKARPDKCKFFCKEITFLGHVVSKEGIKPDKSNIEKVANWPRPNNVASLRSWLGLTGFYRKFIRDYAKISQPLLDLIKKGIKFEWSDDCEHAFQYLRQALVQPPILSYPDFDSSFILYVDASSYAVGSVLAQKDHSNRERVIAYASHSLTQSERKWSTYDRELWAIVWSIRHFKHYLQNCHFQIVSDHKPLIGLRKIPIDNDVTGRRARWAIEIDVMDWTIVHKKGSTHTNADTMSRLTNEQDSISVVRFVEPEPVLERSFSDNSHVDSVSASDSVRSVSRSSSTQNVSDNTFSLANDCDRLRKLQREDPCISKVISWKQSGCPPPLSNFRTGQPVLLKLRRVYRHMFMRNGILWKRHKSYGKPRTLQAVIPSTLVPEILSQLHGPPCVGHFGTEKTMQRALSSFYWPFMYRDINNICQSCMQCQKQRNPVPKHCAPLKPIFAHRPFEMVAADIAELGVTSKGNRYVLVVTDYFTKYVNMYPLQRQTANAVAECLFANYISQHSLMEKLHSDQGAQFEADVIQSLCRKFGVTKLHTSPGHPASDGQTERMNRTIRSQLVRCLQSFPGEWDDLLPQLELAYNSSTHSSTGYSPFYLAHGREPRLPAKVMFGPYDTSLDDSENMSSYAAKVEKNMKAASQMVRNTNKIAHEKQKQQYDKRVRFQAYQIDQLVYLTNPKGVRNKLETKWIGPFRVMQVFNDGLNYQIVDPMSSSAKPKIVHYNRLKPHYQSDGRYDNVHYPKPYSSQLTNQDDFLRQTSFYPQNDGVVEDFAHRPIPSQVSRAHFRRLRDGRGDSRQNIPRAVPPRERQPSVSSSPQSPKTPSPSASRQAALQHATLQATARLVGNEGRITRGMPRDGQVSRFGRTVKVPKRLTYN